MTGREPRQRGLKWRCMVAREMRRRVVQRFAMDLVLSWKSACAGATFRGVLSNATLSLPHVGPELVLLEGLPWFVPGPGW